jgi:hypothetical protein
MGVGFVVETARWRCPDGVAILKVADLRVSLPLLSSGEKTTVSPLLANLRPVAEIVPNTQPA